jgi:hypothetical protein
MSARRARQVAAAVGAGPTATLPPAEHEATNGEQRAARRRRAQVIRRISETDPLICPRCGGTIHLRREPTQTEGCGHHGESGG